MAMNVNTFFDNLTCLIVRSFSLRLSVSNANDHDFYRCFLQTTFIGSKFSSSVSIPRIYYILLFQCRVLIAVIFVGL